MEAVAALLRGLPLQPEESDRGDLMEAKSQLFLKYFTLFMNLLNDCMEAQEVRVCTCVCGGRVCTCGWVCVCVFPILCWFNLSI